MKKVTLAILLSIFLADGFAQDDQDILKYGETITKDDLYDYLSILASDALEGRETGERGQKMAAAFISNHFKELGLQGPVDGNYLQPVELYSSIPGDIYISIRDKKIKNFENVIYFGSTTTNGEIKTDIVFAGKGTKEDFDKVNVEDQAVLVLVDNFRQYTAPAEIAKDRGAKITFVVPTKTDAEFSALSARFKRFLTGGSLSVNKPSSDDENAGVFFVSPGLAAEIFKTDSSKLFSAAEESSFKKLKNKPIVYQTTQEVNTVDTENVLGYLEGTDKKEELVVITAHYDHIGRNGDQINNGADDDGSGTSAVMEMAEAFVQAKKDGKGPRRSILFMAVTGEEKGLLGSAYYAENPVFPLENTIVDLNIDMIGRVDEAHANNRDYVYLVGSDRLSSELHEISEKVNEEYTKFDLDYTYNDEAHPDRIYYRSDHWNFAKNNVPIIFYFNGVHDDYHQPSDTIDKIEFDLLTKRTKLVFYTAWVLANRDSRPVVDKIQDTQINKN